MTQTGRAGGWGEEETKVPKTLSGSSHAATEECSEGTGLLTLRPVHFAGHQAVSADRAPRCCTSTSEAVRARLREASSCMSSVFPPSELTAVAEVVEVSGIHPRKAPSALPLVWPTGLLGPQCSTLGRVLILARPPMGAWGDHLTCWFLHWGAKTGELESHLSLKLLMLFQFHAVRFD